MIEEVDGKFQLLSRLGKLLGTFDTRDAVEKEERRLKFLKKRRLKRNGKGIN